MQLSAGSNNWFQQHSLGNAWLGLLGESTAWQGNVDGSVGLAEKAKIILGNRKENVGVLRSEKGSPKAGRFTASPSSGDVRRQQG